MKTRSQIRRATILLLGLLAGGTAAAKVKNFSVDSINQPVVSGNQATVPNCPNWSSAGLDSASMTDSNYGCSVNANLAAMIADPADLLHGRSDSRTDTESTVRAIKAWREAAPTSKLWETTTKESAKGGGGQ
jgi:pilus assembly protein CpaD